MKISEICLWLRTPISRPGAARFYGVAHPYLYTTDRHRIHAVHIPRLGPELSRVFDDIARAAYPMGTADNLTVSEYLSPPPIPLLPAYLRTSFDSEYWSEAFPDDGWEIRVMHRTGGSTPFAAHGIHESTGRSAVLAALRVPQ